MEKEATVTCLAFQVTTTQAKCSLNGRYEKVYHWYNTDKNENSVMSVLLQRRYFVECAKHIR